MKKVLLLCALIGCGDRYVVDVINVSNIIVNDKADMPKCIDTNNSSIAYVKSESKAYICTNSTWMPFNTNDNSSACSVTNYNGASVISCKDGTNVAISSGINGKDGTSCTIAASGATSRLLRCSDGTQVEIKDGLNGVNGQDCTLSTINNVSTITCGTKSVSITNGKDGINGTNGKDGAGCQIASRGTNVFGLTCGSYTTLIHEGMNGLNGKDGINGKDGANCMIVGQAILCPDGSKLPITNGVDGKNSLIMSQRYSDSDCSNGFMYTSYLDNDNDKTYTNVDTITDVLRFCVKDGANGTNGVDGKNGYNCTISGREIVCPDGSRMPIRDGVDGKNSLIKSEAYTDNDCANGVVFTSYIDNDSNFTFSNADIIIGTTKICLTSNTESSDSGVTDSLEVPAN